MLLPRSSFSYSKMKLRDPLRVQECFLNIKSLNSTATLSSGWRLLLERHRQHWQSGESILPPKTNPRQIHDKLTTIACCI